LAQILIAMSYKADYKSVSATSLNHFGISSLRLPIFLSIFV